MKLNKIFIFVLLLMFYISGVSAINLNNITFTNEEFYNNTIKAIKIIELSNEKLAIGYIKSSDSFGYLKICNLDGSSCGSEISTTGVAIVSQTMFEDTTNNKIIILQGSTGYSYNRIHNLDGSFYSGGVSFNPASTNYISAVKINSTDFGIGYEDVGDTNSPNKFILCKLDGSSCGSEITINSYAGDTKRYNKIILLSNNDIRYSYAQSGTYNLGRGLTLTSSSGYTNIINLVNFNNGSTSYVDMIEGTDNKLKIVYRDDGNLGKGTFLDCSLNGSSCGSEIIYKNAYTSYNNILEINNKLFFTYREEDTGAPRKPAVIYSNLTGGDIGNQSLMSNDNILSFSTSYLMSSIFTSNSQLITAFADDTLSKGMFAISENIINLFINHNIKEYYNNSNITININITTNANISYILDNGTNINICNDCNSTILTLNTLTDSLHNITFFAVNSDEETNSIANFTIDTIKPNIQLLNFTTTRDKNLNLSLVANVTDFGSGLANCTFNITYLENVTNASQYDIFANCTDTVTLLANGKYNAFILAEDNAGNINSTSINVTFEPYVYIYFNDTSTGLYIDSYNAKVVYPNGYIDYPTITNKSIIITPILNGTQQIGYANITISKYGYNTQIYNLYINETIISPQEFFINRTTLNIKAYDGDTLTQINFNITLLNSTSSLVLTNQFNFTKNYLDIPTGDIQILLSSTGYSNSISYYTITDDTSISINNYLFPSNTSQLFTYTIQDSANGKRISSALIEVQTLYNGTYVSLTQKITTDDGLAYFYLNPNLIYKLIISKDSYVTSTATTVPEIYTYTIKLDLQETNYNYIDTISYSFKPYSQEVFKNKTYEFIGFISGTSFTLLNYELYLDNGTSIYNKSSTNALGTTFTYNYQVPQNYSGSIIQKITYYESGTSKTLIKTYNVNELLNNSMSKFLIDYSENTTDEAMFLKWFVMVIILVSVLIFGSMLGMSSSTLMIIPVLAMFIYAGWISIVLGLVMIFIAITLFIGGKK